jgi:hypothetical protein
MLGLGNTLSTQSTPLSSAPVGFDKTWSFDSDTEGWIGLNSSIISYSASHTPSSDVEKTGILVVTEANKSQDQGFVFDLSTLASENFDNTQAVYYQIVYSLPSTGEFTALDKVKYGSDGSFVDHTNETVFNWDSWVTVTGELLNSGSNDLFSVEFDPFASSNLGDKIYVDSVRISHTDFR